MKRCEEFLSEQLDYDLYSEHFADDLAEILQDNLPEDQAEDAQTLARECARNEADAVDKVKKVLAGIGLNMDRVLGRCAGPQGERARARVRAARTGRRHAGR